MKWERKRSLRLKLAAPAKGRGRLQVQIRRAFISADGQALSATEIYNWT